MYSKCLNHLYPLIFPVIKIGAIKVPNQFLEEIIPFKTEIKS